VDDRRRVDAGNDGLREIPQWPWRRGSIRWIHHAGCSCLWKLRRPDRPRFDLYPRLQELLTANVGSAGELNTNGLNRWTHMTRSAMLISASILERLSRMRKRAVGYNGRGRQNRLTIGHIPPVSSMAGSHKTLLNATTPTSAANALRTFIYNLNDSERGFFFESRIVD
jgi:hypothetical protein